MASPRHRGFLLQPTYRVRGGVPVIQLYGRLEEGPAFVVEEDRFRPYFFVPNDAVPRLREGHDIRIEETGLRDFAGEPVSRVVVDLPSAVPPLREWLRARGIEPLESDLRFPYRYLIDRGIGAGLEIEGEPDRTNASLWRFHDPVLRAADVTPELRVLSIDLETSLDAGWIFAAALVGCGVSEVLLQHEGPVEGARVEPDEKSLVQAVIARVRELDPDVIVGWNVVDFDLRVLVRRAEDLGLRPFLGRANEATAFRQDPGFTRQTRAEMPGRVVLDGIPLVRDALRLEDYRLETVARAVLSRGKRIDQEAPDAGEEIQRLYREEPAALVAYNREDAQLVLDILEREGLLDLTIERSRLTGQPLDRVSGSVASFDRVYLPELRRHGRVAPSVAALRERVGVKGGAVLDGRPGVFRRVAVYDFKSLYPSLIRTFQLDPVAHADAAAGEEAAVVAPNGARFARSGALLPDILVRWAERREAAKARGDQHADQAIKIMMNALFGVLGTPSCRFFDPAVANAITGFGQQTLHWTRDAFEAAGVSVLYGDTDSVFVALEDQDPDALRSRIEHEIETRITREYGVESRLTLELEKVFERFWLPRLRGAASGSKKRYAGTVQGAKGAIELVIVGLESVRRDWPRVAERLQRGMLERLFRDEPVLPFVREVALQVRAGALDEELVYVKRIRKGSLEQYTASTPPHIQAARKAGRHAGRIIRYVITQTGPEPALPGRPLPARIDRVHYLDRVLRPVADAILVETGESFDEALGLGKQLSLL